MSTARAIDWAAGVVADGLLPGAVLAVADAGGPVEVWAGGEIGGRAVAVDDRFPLFSVTKPLVALTALQEIEAGRLSLDTPLAEAVPEVATRHPVPIVLRHLLEHSSGLEEPPLDTPDGLEPSLLAAGSMFPAGSAVSYSSLAFHGIARLVARSADRSFEDVLADTLAGAGAPHISFDAFDAHRVPGIPPGELDEDRFYALRHPGAGLFGEVGDLLTLGSTFLRDDGTLVEPTTLAASRIPTLAETDPDPEPNGLVVRRGLGWMLLSRGRGPVIAYGHAGWAGAEFWMLPDVGLTVTLLTARPLGVDRSPLLAALGV